MESANMRVVVLMLSLVGYVLAVGGKYIRVETTYLQLYNFGRSQLYIVK